MAASPNIALVVVDCLRSRTVFGGDGGAHIPTIRSIMREGMSFPHTVASATITTPSMASLLTGTLPFEHGVRTLYDSRLSSNVMTIAEILSIHGYYTHAETTGPVVRQLGFDRGFDNFHHRDANDENVFTHAWSDVWTRMNSLPSDRPWFLYVHFFELHEIQTVPRGFDRRSQGATRYERALSALDQLRLAPLLNRLGEDAVVVLTADHGEIVPRFGLAVRAGERLGRTLRLGALRRYFEDRHGHGNHVIEDLILVPLLLRGSPVPKRRRVEASVRHVDVFPTLLELAGIEEHRGVQAAGRSLLGFARGETASRPGYVEGVSSRMAYPRPTTVAVRDGDLKYGETLDGQGRWLWRLPDEQRDVSLEDPGGLERMRELLETFRARVPASVGDSALSRSEQIEVEEHLRDLGYID